jgi:aspartate/methionine/tyrosine aminotransferase
MDVLSRAQALERAGRRVVHMEIGEPDFTAPAPVVEAGIRAMREGRTAYTAALGLDSLRETIADHYKKNLHVEVPAARIAITAGASGALLTVAALYVDAGDEVLVPDPGYPGYRHFVRAFEAWRRSCRFRRGTISSRRSRWCARPGGRGPRGCCSARLRIPPGH